MADYDIKPKDGHWEVYINGKFYCTADTKSDAILEVLEYEERKETNV